MKKLQHGFTLIELMIVVAIMAILGAMVVSAYEEHKAKLNVVEPAIKTKCAESKLPSCQSDNH